jgi:hypothetical protein
MAYETKTLLAAMAAAVRKAKTVKEVYDILEEIANVEGVILKPFEDGGEKGKPMKPAKK